MAKFKPGYKKQSDGFMSSDNAPRRRYHDTVKSVSEAFLDDSDINARGRNGFTALQTIIWSNSVDSVGLAAELLRLGADPNIPCNEGWTPLHGAVKYGAVTLIQELLKHGAQINASQNEGRTPLLYAVEREQWDSVTILLQNGANANICSYSGRSPLSEVAGYTEKEYLLRQYGARR
uniref:Uncharacterized protein n=1 Tax=Bionectria ochroleuca TaxID=29856 RepID=A0A8H7NHC3_BIOOC